LAPGAFTTCRTRYSTEATLVDFNAVLRRARDASKLGVTGVTSRGNTGNTFKAGVTGDVLPRKAIDNNELDKQVTPVTPVTYRCALAEFKERRPHGVTRLRHDQACWVAEMFLNEWEPMAAEFGWSADDIFARNGLAWWLGTELVSALGTELAVTETHRIYDRVTRKDWPARAPSRSRWGRSMHDRCGGNPIQRLLPVGPCLERRAVAPRPARNCRGAIQ
jgi:hypothetical protein